MAQTCDNCDADAIATMNQQTYCDEHAKEKLEELQEERNELQEEFEQAKNTYMKLQKRYDVNGYGQIEHQLNVEGRDDISEEDVQAVKEAEGEFASKRQELKGVEALIEDLEKDL